MSYPVPGCCEHDYNLPLFHHHPIARLVQENGDVAMDSIIHITQQMSQARRAEVARILEAFDATKPTNGNGNGGENMNE